MLEDKKILSKKISKRLFVIMPWGKKKSYQLVPNKKNSSKNSTSFAPLQKSVQKIMLVHLQASSSIGSSKGLIRKNDAPLQVKKSTKLKKML